jgi:hypothetical protein
MIYLKKNTIVYFINSKKYIYVNKPLLLYIIILLYPLADLRSLYNNNYNNNKSNNDYNNINNDYNNYNNYN